jgi:hypothetical protein
MVTSADSSASPTLIVGAWTFALSAVETRQVLGVAILSVEARYASVYWMDRRIERRHLTGEMWSKIAADLEEGFTQPGPVAKARAVATVLTGSRGALIDVQFLRRRSVEVAAPTAVTAVLDGMLRTEEVSTE